MNWLVKWEVNKQMDKLVQAILNWITLGPLKGHRTVALSFLQFVLAGMYGTGHLKMFTPEQYASVSAGLAAAIGLAAADHGQPKT